MIGTGNKADIIIPENTMMSSEHAILLYRRGKFLFRDNLSTNGSFINGEEIMGDVELANYDNLNMGNTEFRLIMVDPPIIS
jgi:pSer/pThr/pTyr-binding forkhead associated (FHA) protein